MRRAALCSILLVLLYSRAAIAGTGETIPDAPSEMMVTNAAFKLNIRPRSAAAEPAPKKAPVIDRQFLMLSAIATSAIFADSYTTTWIGNNYRARGGGPCTAEGGEPVLYGLHPTVARSYEIAAAMSGGAIAVGYVAKKYLPARMKWLWPASLLYETSISIHGFGTNLSRC